MDKNGKQNDNYKSVADLGEGRSPPPLFWVKKEEMTEGRKAGGGK